MFPKTKRRVTFLKGGEAEGNIFEGKKLWGNCLLYAGWLKNLLRFQGAQPDQVQVESSCCCFPGELVSFVCPRELVRFDPWQSENVFELGGITKLIDLTFVPPGVQSGWIKLSSQLVSLQHALPLIKPLPFWLRVETLLFWTLRSVLK